MRCSRFWPEVPSSWHRAWEIGSCLSSLVAAAFPRQVGSPCPPWLSRGSGSASLLRCRGLDSESFWSRSVSQPRTWGCSLRRLVVDSVDSGPCLTEGRNAGSGESARPASANARLGKVKIRKSCWFPASPWVCVCFHKDSSGTSLELGLVEEEVKSWFMGWR